MHICVKMSSRKRQSGLKDSPKTKRARIEEAGTSKSAEVCLITITRLYNTQQFFFSCKSDDFQLKKKNMFFLFSLKIDCGYTLEPRQNNITCVNSRLTSAEK